MLNKGPGAPNFVAIGFEGGYHGKFMTSLSVSSLNKNIKDGVSTYDWPIAPFPKIQYPYDEFYNENVKEENRCVGEVEKIIKLLLILSSYSNNINLVNQNKLLKVQNRAKSS